MKASTYLILIAAIMLSCDSSDKKPDITVKEKTKGEKKQEKIENKETGGFIKKGIEIKEIEILVPENVVNLTSHSNFANIVFFTNSKAPIKDLKTIGTKEGDIGIGYRKDDAIEGLVFSGVFIATLEPHDDRNLWGVTGLEISKKMLKVLKHAGNKVYENNSWYRKLPVVFTKYHSLPNIKPFKENPTLKLLITYKEFEEEIFEEGDCLRIKFVAE
ncbi:MAG: hypothetical protein PVF17_10300 [Ignavibacteria bacterium]|jgi:hypothetical protein